MLSHLSKPVKVLIVTVLTAVIVILAIVLDSVGKSAIAVNPGYDAEIIGAMNKQAIVTVFNNGGAKGDLFSVYNDGRELESFNDLGKGKSRTFYFEDLMPGSQLVVNGPAEFHESAFVPGNNDSIRAAIRIDDCNVLKRVKPFNGTSSPQDFTLKVIDKLGRQHLDYLTLAPGKRGKFKLHGLLEPSTRAFVQVAAGTYQFGVDVAYVRGKPAITC